MSSERLVIQSCGRKIDIRFVKPSELSKDVLGDCDVGRSRRRYVVRVKRSLKDRVRLDTIVHELLHALHPELDESVVEDSATAIAKVLWKLGYRPKEQES